MRSATGRISEGILEKANFKQLHQMLGGNPQHEAVARWIADNIKTDRLQTWFAKNYAKDPSLFTAANQETLKHFDGMHKIPAANFDEVSLKEHDWQSGVDALKNHENAFHAKAGGTTIPASGKKMVDAGNGLAWYDLGKPSCDQEGAAMGHCGNAGDPHDEDSVLSLRRELTQPDGTKVHQPLVTAINNQGWLGEIKGRNNHRPDKKHHDAIIKLLSHKDIHGVVGGGYQSQNNFGFDHLSPSHRAEVVKNNPKFVDFSSADFTMDQLADTAKKVPDIGKYNAITGAALQTKKYSDDIAAKKMTWDQIPHEDLSLMVNHPAFPARSLGYAIKGIPDHVGEDEHQEDADGYLSPHARILRWSRIAKHPDSKNHIDGIVQKDPQVAVDMFKQHLTDAHVDHIVQKDPFSAAARLKDRLTPAHVDHIVQHAPYAAAEHFQDRLTPAHVDHIVRTEPYAAAEHFKDRLTDAHIDHLVQHAPEYAAADLKDRLTDAHVDHIVQHAPYYAIDHLEDRLTPAHVDPIVQNAPDAAARHLKDQLTDAHVDHIVQSAPYAAARLKDRLTAKHVDHLVQMDPLGAVAHLKDRLTDAHVDHIVQHEPEYAAHLRDRLTPAHRKQLGLNKSTTELISGGLMEQPVKPKLKAVVAPKEDQAPKTELDPQLQHPEVQEKFKSIIDSVKGVREKVARLKADKIASSIGRERESDKQKAKIKLAKACDDLKGLLEMLAKAVWEDAPHIAPDKCACGSHDTKHHYTCVDKNPAPKLFTQNKILTHLIANSGDPHPIPDVGPNVQKIDNGNIKVYFAPNGYSKDNIHDEVGKLGGKVTHISDEDAEYGQFADVHFPHLEPTDDPMRKTNDLRDPDEKRADKGKKRWKDLPPMEQIKRRRQQLIGTPKQIKLPGPAAEPEEESPVSKADTDHIKARPKDKAPWRSWQKIK